LLEYGRVVAAERRAFHATHARDGAVWNFPIGRIGRVSLRILLREGFEGATIALTDRFFYPDTVDRTKLTFALSLDREGRLGEQWILKKGRWYTLRLEWQVEQKPPRDRWPGECQVFVDDQPALTLPQGHRAKAGLCYLRLHSTAPQIDSAGFLVEYVAADIED